MLKKYLKNRKGFTLIELMMVIAVIGILAAVLIPKIGATKDNAKLSGVEANARQVQAHVEGLIERYKNHGDQLAGKLKEVINGQDGINSSDIMNPFDNKKYGASSVTKDKAVYITSNNDADNSETAGLICVNVEYDLTTKDLTDVVITPYDELGKKLDNQVITVKP